MKVLWLVNDEPNALADFARPYRSNSGSWLGPLERALGERGDVDLSIACPAATDVELVASGITYFGLGVRTRPPLARLRSNWTGRTPKSELVARMLSVIDEVRPNIVHIHGTESEYVEVIAHTDVPCLVSLQGILTVCERMYNRGLSVRPFYWFDARSVLAGSTPLHGRRSMQKRAVRERHMMQRAEYVAGRTEWDRAIATMLAPQAMYFHCGEMLREAFYARRWSGGTARTCTIYSTIGAAPYKGAETLVGAIALLKEQGHDVRLRLGGLDRKSLAGKTALRIAFRRGIGDRMELLGSLRETEIAEELGSCNVYVSPSHIENSPNALCEALMMGVPTVATAVGGVPSLIQDGTDGLLVQDGDEWHMAAAIADLLYDSERSARLGRTARIRAKERHSYTAVSAQVMAAYRSIMEGRNSHPRG